MSGHSTLVENAHSSALKGGDPESENEATRASSLCIRDHDDAWFVVLVVAYLCGEILCDEERGCSSPACAGRRVRAVAFYPRDTTFVEMSRKLGGDTANKVKPIPPGAERAGGFIVSDARGELAVSRDIRRVHRNDVEFHIAERFKQVADAHIGS